jgi:hypothetical protein
MSSEAKRIFLSARLSGFTGRGDKYLGEIAQELRRVLLKTQKTFGFPTCRLPRDSGVTRFLASPNEYGWDIKRKLPWSGINSCLFRFQFLKCYVL